MSRRIQLLAILFLSILQQSTLHAQWTQLDVGSPWQVWSVAVIGTTEFAGTFAGTYRSTDGGQSWTNVNGDFTNCFVKKGSDIFAGYFNGVLKSTDDGITWTDPDTSLTSNIEHLVVKDSVIFAGGGYVPVDGRWSNLDCDSRWIGIRTNDGNWPNIGRYEIIRFYIGWSREIYGWR